MIPQLVALALALVLAVLLRQLVAWLLTSDEEPGRESGRLNALVRRLRNPWAVPALSIALAVAFSLSLYRLADATFAAPPRQTLPAWHPNAGKLFLDGGLVPAIKAVERVARRENLAPDSIRDLAFAVNDLKAHILEVTFERSSLLQETGFRVQTWDEEQWMDGNYYVTRVKLKLKRIGNTADGFLLLVLPKIDANPGTRDFGQLTVASNSISEPLSSFLVEHSLGDLGRLKVMRVPISENDFDSQSEVEVELLMAAEQQHPFSMYSLDTRPYLHGIGRISVRLHFRHEGPIMYWPGSFDSRTGHITLGQLDSPSPWTLENERLAWVQVRGGRVEPVDGPLVPTQTLKLVLDGAFGEICPAVIGFWQPSTGSPPAPLSR